MDTTQSAQTAAPRGARVGVVRETNPDERRVALVPKIIPSLLERGVEVIVEAGAGLGALIPDEAYTAAGARIGDPWDTDVVVKVAPPNDAEIAKLSSGQTLIGFLAPRNADTKIGA
ncbi:MAG: transhydrogenase (Re/Si-specific), partial [Nocardia sp.]|nr:transhydrogenase (Re/Si-specific) [Nocardia sp.]